MASRGSKKADSGPHDLPERIAKILDSGVSPEGLADKIGCSLATLYRWKAGRGRPHRTMVRMFGLVEAGLGQQVAG